MLERGIAVRQGIGFLRTELPTILATRTDALSPRMLRIIEELAGDWRRLDQRIDGLSREIEALACQDQACSAPDDGARHRNASFRAPRWPPSAPVSILQRPRLRPGSDGTEADLDGRPSDGARGRGPEDAGDGDGNERTTTEPRWAFSQGTLKISSPEKVDVMFV